MERLLFGKVEVWLVLLLALLAMIGGVMFGWVVRRTVTQPDRAGWLGRAAASIAALPDHALALLETGLEVDRAGRLVQRNSQIVEFDSFSGLKIEDPSFEDDGMLLVSAYSGKHGISTVYLYDLKARKRLWEWLPDHDQIVAMTPSLKRVVDRGDPIPGTNRRARFRSQHPFLLDDGGLLLTSGEGVLARIDVHGNVVWTSDRHYHHSIQRMPDGSFIVPIVIEGTDDDVRDDGYAIVSEQGELIEERSILEILKRNGYEGLVYGVGEWDNDRVHLNDAEPILETDAFVRQGDIVFSSRHLSTVFLYRPSEDRVVWLQTGPWTTQHDVDYLGNGLFSVFGNDFVRGRGWRDYGSSNIYVYDMASGEITRPFSDVFTRLELRTPTQGLQRLLDNGDAFVSLTDANQLMRLSGDGIRWRYTSPLGEGTVGALHWSRYFERDEIDLSWLRKPEADGAQVVQH